MASGKLGSADLTAATDTLLFTADAVQTFNVRFANRNATTVKVSVYIGTGANPVAKDCVTPDMECKGNGIIEDTAFVCSIGEKVWVRSNTANVSVRAHGM